MLNNDDILKVYAFNKTEMRKCLENYNNDLIEVINKINDASIPIEYSFRSKIGYPFRRDTLEEKLKRKFVSDDDRIAPEHAQKFYIYKYYTFHKIKMNYFGYVIGYELPFFENRGSGAVDLVAYDDIENTLNLIELKNCAMGPKKDSAESLIRAILEIETYTKFVNEILTEENNNPTLLKNIRDEINELYGLDISLEKLQNIKVKKNLLIPRSLYENSLNNQKECEILKKLPDDISIYFISTKDAKFDTEQIIGDCAMKKEFEFCIKDLKENE